LALFILPGLLIVSSPTHEESDEKSNDQNSVKMPFFDFGPSGKNQVANKGYPEQG
jgi:hypothetical protein